MVTFIVNDKHVVCSFRLDLLNVQGKYSISKILSIAWQQVAAPMEHM